MINKDISLQSKMMKHNKRTQAGLYLKRNYALYLCMIPGIIYYLVFHYAPMVGVVVAFKDYNIFTGIWQSPWAGLKYFDKVIHLPNFFQIIRNTLTLNLLTILIGFPAPIILALMLNEVRSTHFKKISQSLLYIPHFMSWIVLASIVTNLLSPQYGFVNQIIKWMGFDPVFFMAEPVWWIFVYIFSGIWSGVGWGTIIYMAALSNIDPALYEAAMIDGAGKIKQMVYITIPCLMPTITIMLILKLGHIVSIGFEQPMALYNPLVADVAEVISTFSYSLGVQRGQFSLVSALGLMQSVINMGMIIAANKISKKLGSEGLY